MKRRLALVLAVCTMTGATALAANMTFDGVAGDDIVGLNISMPNGYTYGGGGVYAGYYNYSINNGPNIASFCIDFYDESANGPVTWTKLADAPVSTFGNVAMGATAAKWIEALWAQNYSTTLTADQAAVLQVAIWKAIAVADGGTCWVTGTTATQASIDTLANQELTAAENYTGVLPHLFAWTSAPGASPTIQGYIGYCPDGGMTLALLGMAFTGLAVMRSRKA